MSWRCWLGASAVMGKADRRARDLEQAVFTHAVQSMNGDCPAPSEMQWEHARQAREHAKSLFQQVMRVVSQHETFPGPSAGLELSVGIGHGDGRRDV